MAGLLGVLLVAALGAVNSMEMRETVERMVMVRRTGSDLQPAATGYIYRSDNNGPASVIKLGESDINKHLDNIPSPHYEQPKAFAAPIPVAAGPFYNKEESEAKAASQANEYVIPVVEAKEEDAEAKIEDEVKHGEYATDFGHYKNDLEDYISKNYGVLEDDAHHHGEHGGGNDYGAQEHSAFGEKGQKGYASNHHYGKGGAGDYHTEKYESYSVSGAGEHSKHFDDADSYGSSFAHGDAYKGGDHGHKAFHSKGDETDGFHNLFDKEEFKKDHDFYDEEALKGGFHKFGDGHAYHGSGAGGFDKGGAHESGHDAAEFGKEGIHEHGSEDGHGEGHSAEEHGASFHHRDGGFGSEGGYFDGKGYGYNIEH